MIELLSDKKILEIMGEAFWLAAGKRVARKAEQEILRQVADKIFADMPHIADAATYLRKLLQELKEQAEGK